MIELVTWDTDHFNIRVDQYDIREGRHTFNLSLLRNEGILNDFDVIYIKSNKRIKELDDNGIFFDEKIVYTKDINLESFDMQSYDIGSDNQVSIESYKNKEVSEDLIQLSISSGAYSRYRLDKGFSSDCFRRLYIDWIINSVNEDIATDVLVAFTDNKPVGVLTYKNSNSISTIGIIAVDELYREHHIGSKLMRSYFNSLPQSIIRLEVTTQGVNKIARNFYEKNGYKIGEIIYMYHLWIK